MPAESLNPKQARFVEEYLIDLNATAAASRAGYSDGNYGRQLLMIPNVMATIRKAMDARGERTEVTADRVLRELALIAFSRMGDFAQWGPTGVTLLDSDSLSAEAARCVAEVSESTSKDGGSIRFKLHDKVGALRDIGKHLGMFLDRVEHSGELPVIVVKREE